MSGILDNKTRVIDTVITTEGRRQLAGGGIDIKYVSFTDASSYYRADSDTGSEDATKRLYFEASQLPQDDIVFQADGDGNLTPFRNSDGVPTAGGKILDYSFEAVSSSFIGGGSQTVTSLQGDRFTQQAETLLASSINNFQKLYLLATKDKIFEDDGFEVGPDHVTFTITNTRPISDPDTHTAHISAVDSIFSDPRFSNRPNFKYLPPINKTNDRSIDRSDHRATRKLAFGSYSPWGRTPSFGLNYSQTMLELSHFQKLGYEQVINFDPTSSNNQLVGQFFEKSFDTLRKLDVVDFGVHKTGNPATPLSHIFFVGKVEIDEKGTDTFIHIFTLVFE